MFENKPKFGPEHYPAGTVIFRQGDEPDNFYIITRGMIEVLYQPPDALDELIDILGPGDYFGEVGLMRRSRRMATIRAKSDVDVMAMDYMTFRNWIDSSPVIAAEIDAVIEERLLAAQEFPEPLPEHEPIEGMLRYLEDNAQAESEEEETVEHYAKGDVIIRQDDPPDKFYVIIEGFVTVSHTMSDGRKQTIAHLTSGDYFGEIGLLDGSPRIATVTALSDVKLLCFDRETFATWMQKSPGSKDDIQREATRRRKDTGILTTPQNDDK